MRRRPIGAGNRRWNTDAVVASFQIAMHRFTVVRRTFVAIALSAGSIAVAADTTDAPFEATVTTTEALRPNPLACRGFPFIAGRTTGTGTASLLGTIKGTGTDCIHPHRKGRFSFSNGKLTMVSTSGEQLRAEYSGQLTPTATAKVYTIAGTYRITGGTGRFAAATGGGTLSGVENISTRRGRFEFTGVISY